MIVEQVLLGIAGIIASLYSFYVKKQHEKNPKYKAMCDIGPNASCTKVLTSKYGTGFGIAGTLFGKNSKLNASNGNLGIIFYSLQILFGLIPIPLFTKFALFSSVLACVGSLYLAFILAFILKDLCLVCIATYIINAGLLWSNYQTVYYRR
ncbi:hypothetical protein I4U23_019565 [Adineta vaga]|nr:hypothetical protein I4U23_019565 [Adineta vaga]